MHTARPSGRPHTRLTDRLADRPAASVRVARRPAHDLRWRRGWLLLWALLIALAWTGTQAQTATPGQPAAQPDPATEWAYRIARGDELDLRFFYTPELNTRTTVRSDGRISLPLVGELLVEGQTISQLQATVQQMLAAQVLRPQVSINVQGSSQQRVFVGGEVTRPGVQPLVGPLTALQAVMVAEGVRDTAQPSMALVLRRTPSGARQTLPLDLDALMKGQAGGQDIVLQPFDVVVVPRSGIADIGRWVDLYIRRTLPLSFGVNYTIDRNGSAR